MAMPDPFVAGFRLEAPLGPGAFRATQLSTGRPAAVHRIEDPGDLRRLAALTHPNILPVCAADAAAGFVATRLVETRAFAAALPLADALRLGAQAAAALAFAHDRGFVHGDLRADDILSDDGVALVSGIGWHRTVRRPVDDVAALAAILHERISGRNPLAPDPPEPVVAALLRAMAGECSADELRRALTDLTPSAAVHATRSEAARTEGPALSESSEARRVEGFGARRFGKFILYERIGRGGMGVVYRAEEPGLGRLVALKVLHEGEDLDEQPLKRFQREARSVALLRHPNIIPIHEFGEAEGRHYFTMDLIQGSDLASRFLDPRTAAEAVRDAARAVHYAHQHGIVHRDLKPGNVMLDDAGRLYVMDFGLARTLRVDSKVSSTGVAIGTPAYMAPEQAAGDPDVGPLADVYALGATLYSLLARRAPFDGDSPADVMLRVLMEDPPRLRSLVREAPADLETIAMRAMEKEPARRYENAEALAADLDRWLAGEPIQARPPSLLYRLRKRLAKRRAVVFTLLASAAVLAGVVLLLVPPLLRHRAELAVRDATRPLDAVIQDARNYTYISGSDILEKLRRAKEAVVRLEALAQDPAGERIADVWISLGSGCAVVGDLPRAEQALLKADALAPGDARVNLALGRIYLQRSLEARAVESRRAAAEQAAAWAAKAVDRLQQPVASWTGAGEIERAAAAAYRAFAAGRTDEAVRLCEEGTAKFGDSVGTEEFWLVRALAEKDREKQIEHLTRALNRRPHFEWALIQRGLAHGYRDEVAKAIADWDAALKLSPRRGFLWEYRGAACQQSGDLDRAIQDLTRAIELSPEPVSALCGRAAVRRENGDIDGALADVGEALRRDPAYSSAVCLRGIIKRERGDVPGAIADYTEAIRLDAANVRAWASRSYARRVSGDLAGAEADAEQAIRVQPRFADAYVYRAMCRKMRGDLSGAREDFDAALRRNPRLTSARLQRGLLRLETDDLRGALADFNELLSNAPAHAAALRHRADTHLLLGDRTSALADYTEVLKLQPDNDTVWGNRGVVRQQLGDLDGALADLNEAVRLRPDSAKHRHNRGRIHHFRGEKKEAVAGYTEAIGLDPNHADAYYNRAMARLQEGDARAALPDFDAAIRLRADFADAYLSRASARRRLGDRKRAVADCEKALEVAPAKWPAREEAKRMLDELVP